MDKRAGPSILFLCVANSARSQMAEGLARARFGAAVRVQSAGSSPTRVHPLAIAALAELGIDIAEQRSKSVATIDAASIDLVVTLCAEEQCPLIYTQARRLHWPLPDPAAGSEGPASAELEAFRRVRNVLRERLEQLAAELLL